MDFAWQLNTHHGAHNLRQLALIDVHWSLGDAVLTTVRSFGHLEVAIHLNIA